MSSPMDRYEEICALSAQMVEAARAGDWEELIRLERSVSALGEALTAEDGGTLAPEDALRKAAVIQRILDDDAEIRRHTEPWMERLRVYLSGHAAQPQAASIQSRH